MTFVKIDAELSDKFSISFEVRQGCVIIPWLFNVYMDGVMTEVNAGELEVGVKISMSGNIVTNEVGVPPQR